MVKSGSRVKVKGKTYFLDPLTLVLFPRNPRIIVPNLQAITRKLHFGELSTEVLVIGVDDLGRFVRLSFAYGVMEAEMPIVSSIDKLRLY